MHCVDNTMFCPVRMFDNEKKNMAKSVICLFQIDFQVKYIFCVSKYTFCAHASKEEFEIYLKSVRYLYKV